jgi:hypothetical protein
MTRNRAIGWNHCRRIRFNVTHFFPSWGSLGSVHRGMSHRPPQSIGKGMEAGECGFRGRTQSPHRRGETVRGGKRSRNRLRVGLRLRNPRSLQSSCSPQAQDSTRASRQYSWRRNGQQHRLQMRRIGRSQVKCAKVAHRRDTVRANRAKSHAQTIHLLLSLKRHRMIKADLSDPGLVRACFGLCSALDILHSSGAE